MAQIKINISRIHLKDIRTTKIMIYTKGKSIKIYKQAMGASIKSKVSTIANIKINKMIIIAKTTTTHMINIKIFQNKTLEVRKISKGTNIIKINFTQKNTII